MSTGQLIKPIRRQVSTSFCRTQILPVDGMYVVTAVFLHIVLVHFFNMILKNLFYTPEHEY